MTMSHSDVNKLLVLVSVDDPALQDQDFIGLMNYGGFVKERPDFTEENVQRARNIPEDEMTHGKFMLEIFTDRFIDFVYTVLPHPEWQRALIFRQAVSYIPDADDLPDDMPEEALAEFVQQHLIYEMRSISRVSTQQEVHMDQVSLDLDTEEEKPAYLH
jgi:hypothetical protein